MRAPARLRPARALSALVAAVVVVPLVAAGTVASAPPLAARREGGITSSSSALAAPELPAPTSPTSPTSPAPASPTPSSPGRRPAAEPAAGATPAPEAYPEREPQTDCDVVDHRGIEVLRDIVLEAYPETGDGGVVRDCGAGGSSEHKEGRAWDWMVDASDPAHAAAADEVLGWLLAPDPSGVEHALARRLGLLYVIWDGRIWSASRADQGWRPYDGASPHTDHVHLSFSTAGATGSTSFFAPVWQPEVGRSYPETVPHEQVLAAPTQADGRPVS